MKKVLKVGFNEYEILDSRELYEGEPLRFGDRRTAAQFLRRFQRTPMGPRLMRDFVERGGALGVFARVEDSVVMERLAVMLASRRVLVVPRAAIYVVPSPDVEEPAAVVPQLATEAPVARPRSSWKRAPRGLILERKRKNSAYAAQPPEKSFLPTAGCPRKTLSQERAWALSSR